MSKIQNLPPEPKSAKGQVLSPAPKPKLATTPSSTRLSKDEIESLRQETAAAMRWAAEELKKFPPV